MGSRNRINCKSITWTWNYINTSCKQCSYIWWYDYWTWSTIIRSDAATKTYVDDLVTGLKTRIITRAATTGNITLSSDLQNGDTLDGVTLATGNKVLVKDQTDATENGIYNVVASGTATRDTDYDTVAELIRTISYCSRGSN